MRPIRPVPSGCCQKARLRRCSTCRYSRYWLRLAPSIHRFLAEQRIRESKSDRLLMPPSLAELSARLPQAMAADAARLARRLARARSHRLPPSELTRLAD